MSLVAIGINHKTATVDVREKVAFSPEKIHDAMKSLAAHTCSGEAVIISTCNRTELYSKTHDSISVSVYPNPIRQSELRLSCTTELEKIQLFDLRGRAIAMNVESIENLYIIRIEENIKPGVYLLQTKSRDQILTTKILVE